MHLTSKTKRLIAALLSLSILTTVFLPISVNAETGTLGTESPHIYTSFVSDTSEDADGNTLDAGTYDVTFHLTGMSSFSVLQLFATFDSSVITVNSTTSLMDAQSDIVIAGAASVGVSDFVVGYLTTNTDCSSIGDDTALISLNVTVTSDTAVDFEDVFTLVENPNQTYIEADRNDTFHNCYALVDTFDGYDGELHLMTSDLSPASASSTVTVTGTTKQMTSITGDMGNIAPGLTVTIGDITTTTADDGSFTIEGVPMDATEMVVSGASTYDRTIALDTSTAVNGVVDLGDKAIICCNYTKDSTIDARDLSKFSSSLGYEPGSEGYNIFTNFNGDSAVDARDLSKFSSFLGLTFDIAYDSVVD